MTTLTTTQADINGSEFGWASFGNGLLGLGQAYLGSLLESQVEPAPTVTSQYQTVGVNTDTLETPQGANLENQAPAPELGIPSKYLMYGLYGVIGLIALLIILKLFGVI